MKNYKLLLLGFIASFVVFSCTEDTGTVEVTYQEATAIYGDIEEIRSTPLNGTIQQISNPGKIYIAEDYVLIGEEGQGVHVIDNSDRVNPLHTSFINIPGNREFFVKDNVLYAESYYDMMKVDISDPNNAQLLSRAEYAIQDQFVDSDGNQLIGFSYEEKTVTLTEDDDFLNEVIGDQLVFLDYAQNIIPNSAIPSSFAGNSSSQSGTVNRVTKTGDYVYVISNNNMIVLNDNQFDSDFVKWDDVKEDMETIFPYQDKLFVGSRSSMAIYSLEDAQAPRGIYDFDHATSCDPVLPHSDVAYVTLRTADFSECPGNINALIVIDINDLSSPSQVDEIQMKSPYGMTVIGDQLYVGEGANGLKIFDVSNTAKPELVNDFSDIEAYDIIADPTNPSIIFIAGPNGLDQFGVNADLTLDLKSTVASF